MVNFLFEKAETFAGSWLVFCNACLETAALFIFVKYLMYNVKGHVKVSQKKRAFDFAEQYKSMKTLYVTTFFLIFRLHELSLL